MAFDQFAAVDDDLQFPQSVREANAATLEFRNQVLPMTQTVRNNLTGDELWDGRLVYNLTTKRLNVYDLATDAWGPVSSEPPGIVKEYGGDAAPEFHVLADGSVYPRDGVYAALFAVYGTKYNTGGETGSQFRVPDRRGRTAVGRHPSQTEFDTLGKTGGAKTHTLSGAEVPSHSHGGGTGGQSADHSHTGGTDSQGLHQHQLDTNQIIPGTLGGGGGSLVREGFVSSGGRITGASGAHSHAVSVGGASVDHAHGISPDGGGGAHNNLQPYITMNFIITL